MDIEFENGSTVFLTVREAWTLVEASMRGVSHTQTEAEVIADLLIDCELRGLSFGGLPRALPIIERINAATVPRRPMAACYGSNNPSIPGRLIFEAMKSMRPHRICSMAHANP